jgi:L-asparaginase
MSILILSTGGTIGAMPYKDIKHQIKIKTMPPKGQDFVRAACQKIQVKARYLALEARDSNFIDDAYRQTIVDTIKQAPESAILITHGTDSLLGTANYFLQQLAKQSFLKDKTIIFTGAMVALSCGEKSDGMPNLRFALRQLEQGQMMRGIYIVLCDYQEPETKAGWSPRLYKFEPGRYEKFYDEDDNSRSRLQYVKR